MYNLPQVYSTVQYRVVFGSYRASFAIASRKEKYQLKIDMKYYYIELQLTERGFYSIRFERYIKTRPMRPFAVVPSRVFFM